MPDERIDIYDQDNNKLGSAMKSEAHAKGLWHHTVHIWMYTPTGKVLLQLRAKDKDLYPNCWDISVAGHVHAGETESEAALREIKEEIGIDIEPTSLEFIRVRSQKNIYKDIIHNEFTYVYLYPLHTDPNKLTIQREELERVKVIGLAELEQDLQEYPERYFPHGKYWQEMIMELRNKIESHK